MILEINDMEPLASVISQFLRIDGNIIRCTYTPGTEVQNESLFIQKDMMFGTPESSCPLPIESVTFTPRDVYHWVRGADSKERVLNTANGEHVTVDGLEEVLDRTSFRGTVCLSFAETEHIFGLGQDEDGVWNKRGRIEYLYQHNKKIAMPMFVSDRGYGVLFNCACLMIFDDRTSPCNITLECVDQVDFFVIQGSMDEIVAGYRRLTGAAAPMPDWVMGYWQSKERYVDQEELLAVATRYREDKVPLDVVVQDWSTWIRGQWGDKHPDLERYPDLKGTMDKLHAQNVRCVFSIWPNTKGGKDALEFAEKGLMLSDNNTYNAFSAEGRNVYWKQLQEDLYPSGIDGWWCDSTEPFADADWGGQPVRRSERERYDVKGTPLKETKNTKDCYLPFGADWYDFHTGTFYPGGQTVSVSVDLNHIPLFVRAGAKIPVTEDTTFAEEQGKERVLDFPVK